MQLGDTLTNEEANALPDGSVVHMKGEYFGSYYHPEYTLTKRDGTWYYGANNIGVRLLCKGYTYMGIVCD